MAALYQSIPGRKTIALAGALWPNFSCKHKEHFAYFNDPLQELAALVTPDNLILLRLHILYVSAAYIVLYCIVIRPGVVCVTAAHIVCYGSVSSLFTVLCKRSLKV